MTRRSRGFTLIEMIIYLAIFSMIAACIVPVFFNFESSSSIINGWAAELSDRIFIESVFRNLVATGHEGEIVFSDASSTLVYNGHLLHGPRLQILNFLVIKNEIVTEYFLRDNFFAGTTTVQHLKPI